MAFELKQNLKLAQQLIMTPQLQQAIKLLQLSRLELVDTINQEMEENPFLEEVSPDENNEDLGHSEVEEDVQTIDRDDTKAVERTIELTGEGDGREEFDWGNYLEDYGPVGVSYESKDAEPPAW
ncbi:MAG: RNA polymerase sigma-54 factor, partial [Smithellaceae bacterium]